MYKRIIRRSRLIMPINQRKFVEKAWQRNADTIVLDLEDSVPYEEKVASRGLIQSSVEMVKRGGSNLFIRINAESELWPEDLKAAVIPGVDGIILPKVESGIQVREIAKLIDDYELVHGIKAGHVQISILIESAKGYLNMKEILESSDRIDALTLGAEDFVMDMDMSGADVNTALLNIRMNVVVHARAYGVLPLGLLDTIADYQDLDAIEESARRAKSFGFVGSSCIHPAQVEIFNRVFKPTGEEITESQALISAFESHLAKGHASALYQGKMIDYVHYLGAQKVVAKASAILDFEAEKAVVRSSHLNHKESL